MVIGGQPYGIALWGLFQLSRPDFAFRLKKILNQRQLRSKPGSTPPIFFDFCYHTLRCVLLISVGLLFPRELPTVLDAGGF